jgi:hypothetical protein
MVDEQDGAAVDESVDGGEEDWDALVAEAEAELNGGGDDEGSGSGDGGSEDTVGSGDNSDAGSPDREPDLDGSSEGRAEASDGGSDTDSASTETAEFTDADREQLEALAKKAGLQLLDGAVTNKDHIALRQHRQQIESRLQKTYAEREAKVRQMAEQLEKAAPHAMAMEKARRTKDVEAMAKIMGYESFAKLTQDHVETMADPGRKEIQEFRREAEAREARLMQRIEALQQAQQPRQPTQQEVQAQYEQRVAQEIVADGSIPQTLKESEPFFMDVMTELRTHYDGHTTIPPHLAARNVLDRYRQAAETVNHQQSAAEGATGKSLNTDAEKPAKRPPLNVSQDEAADASGSVEDDEEFDEAKWLKEVEEYSRQQKLKARAR